MFSSTTQETLVDDEGSPTHAMLMRSISALDEQAFQNFIEQQYGACWGTLKFEDSLSDYSNDVRISMIFHTKQLFYSLLTLIEYL